MSPSDWKVLQIFSLADTSTPTVTPVRVASGWAPPAENHMNSIIQMHCIMPPPPPNMDDTNKNQHVKCPRLCIYIFARLNFVSALPKMYIYNISIISSLFCPFPLWINCMMCTREQNRWSKLKTWSPFLDRGGLGSLLWKVAVLQEFCRIFTGTSFSSMCGENQKKIFLAILRIR